MKLRFVKFFTSRENEIEKKEGGGGRSPAITRSTTSQLARNHSPAPALPFSLHHFILSPSTQPRQPTSSVAPACRPPRVGRAIFSSYLLPSCSASSFLIHKITEATERGGCHVAERPACRPSCSVRAPSSPAGPRPSGSSLVLHRLHLLPALGAVHPQRLEP